ncbi:MAG: preprotein translocase subunit SecG [Bacteroidetes bacterium]|jgi:preprotein translocase subunit SecG|nr:preprotein translocase subunit SecG [Bacteroidota bacterium]
MFTFLIILIALIGVIMTFIVLVQAGRGGGLAGIASGGSTTQILGARQAPDILEKATWTLAVLFIVLCILTNFAIDTAESQESIIQERAQEEQTVPPAPPGTQETPAQPPATTPQQNGGGQ